MDKVIRVLALDDDNHDSMFATEEGETFENARFLLEKLGKPHSETYDIRGFCLIDYVGPAEKLDDALVDWLFGYVGGFATAPKGYTYAEAFNLLWESSQTRWRV